MIALLIVLSRFITEGQVIGSWIDMSFNIFVDLHWSMMNSNHDFHDGTPDTSSVVCKLHFFKIHFSQIYPGTCSRWVACLWLADHSSKGAFAVADGRCCATGGSIPQCIRSGTVCRRQLLGAVLAHGENWAISSRAGHMGSQSMAHSIILFSFIA